MTWQDFMAARQVLAEERIGAPRRAVAAAEIAAEDAAVEATKGAIRRTMPRVA